MEKIELINSDQETLKLEAYHIELSERNIMIDSLKTNNNLFLVEFSHKGIHTLLDFTGLNDYQVLAFDKENKFIGASLALNNESGFIIQTQAKKVLIIPYTKYIKEAQKTAKLMIPKTPKS